MAKPKKKPSPAPDFTQDQAAKVLGEIGQLQRRVADLETTMNAELEAVREKFHKALGPLADRIFVRGEALFAWAEANRAQLLKPNVKTVQFPTGQILWRLDPPSVRLKKVEAVIAALKAARLRKFLRFKTEVDKEAILKEPKATAKIAGITIVQDERVVLKPHHEGVDMPELDRKVTS